MKNRLFIYVVIILSFGYSKVYSQTDWILDNSRTPINTSLLDSITFTKEVNRYFQNLWHKGQIIEKEEIEEGYSYEPKEVQLEYEYCTFEEDGFDGILTNNGNYAILQYAPDSTGYILTSGSIKDDSYSCISFDTLGYVTGIKTSDNRTYQVIYSPNEIWLFDSKGFLSQKSLIRFL